MQQQKIPHRITSILHEECNLDSLKLLIVGVGGIGCELLKVLCKMPIGRIDIIDMDTIEISNLNRQFLFKAEHKGQSKALVAKQTIQVINPHLNIQAHHKNIRELPITFFQSFSHLIMALDNIETRNYVNKIGVRLNIPTIDAGTLGYKGNVHIIIPGKTRCYSCQPKVSSQKSFPVCTIRMRPQKPIHCIVWAKMLFEVLFSGQEVNNDMKDMAVLAESGDEGTLLRELFFTEINNIKNAKTDSDSLLAQDYIQKIKPVPLEELVQNKAIDMDNFDSFDSANLDKGTLIGLAKVSFLRLLEQKKKQKSVLFEKDDDTIIHFVSSLANLRMSCFSIQQQSFNEVKNMAGNIVPAIASTNSIVSGLQVIEMIKLMTRGQESLKSYYIQNQHYKVRALKVQKPVPGCLICSPSARPVIMETDMKTATFNEVVQWLSGKLASSQIEAEYSINKGEKELYNSEQPNMKIVERKLIQLAEGAYELDLKIIDQDHSQTICALWIIHNEESKALQVTNDDQLDKNYSQNRANRIKNSHGMVEQKPEEQDKSDSDCGVMEVKQGQPEDEDDDILITEVRKPETKQGMDEDDRQVIDKVEKKIKEL